MPVSWPLTAIALFLVAASTARAEPPLATVRHGSYVHALAFSPDAKLLASASNDQNVRLWDVATAKQWRALPVGKDFIQTVAFSSDGRWLAAGTTERNVFVWSMEAVRREEGGEPRRLTDHAGPVLAVAFAPDGKLLAAAGEGKQIVLWDVVSGKERRRIESPQVEMQALAFAPDGKGLASAGRKDHVIVLWDPETGQELRRSAGRHGGIAALAFAGDGRVLASAGTSPIRLWDPASLNTCGELAGHRDRRRDGVDAIAFSRDGKFAVSGGQDRKVKLWERATQQEVLCHEAHQGSVCAVALTSDGKRLASADLGTTIYLWDATGVGQMERAAWTAEQREDLWKMLAGADASAAYRAIWQAASDPEQGVALVKARLDSIPVVDAGRIKELSADLGSTDFERRQKAADELEKLNELAEPALRQMLAGKLPSLEVRRRLERIVDKLGGPVRTPQAKLAVRVTALLERCGTADARDLLETLAKGPAESWLAREARAALERLGGR